MASSTAVRFDLTRAVLTYLTFDVAASTKIYSGTMVCTDASGNLNPAADTSGLIFQGIAQPSVPGGIVDNSGGIAGAQQCPVDPFTERVPGTKFLTINCTSADKTWIGKRAAILDDHTVQLSSTSTNHIVVGTIKQVISATQVIVDCGERFVLATT